MINLPKIAFVARLCLLLTIAFAVAWLLISSITVAPRLDETFQRFSLLLACGFLLFVSLTAILYAFAPRRNALLILGGDKTGNDRWYEENVPKAERIYEQYLKEIEEETK